MIKLSNLNTYIILSSLIPSDFLRKTFKFLTFKYQVEMLILDKFKAIFLSACKVIQANTYTI